MATVGMAYWASPILTPRQARTPSRWRSSTTPYQSVTQAETVTVGNAPPVASFTRTCSWLTCTFNGSASSDPDGMIATYAWTFGDGTTVSGATANRTYAAADTYAVTLTVTDNGGATSHRDRQSGTVLSPDLHVGDLDRATTNPGNQMDRDRDDRGPRQQSRRDCKCCRERQLE